MKKNNLFLLIVVIILSIILVLLFNINTNNSKSNNDKNHDNYILLKDYSRFFTINSCIYKYISYLSGNNSEDLLSVLDKDYVEKNNIDVNNVYEHLDKLNGNYTFKSKKIYYKKINDNYITYYVYGYLIEDILNKEGEKQEKYYIVNLDIKNQLFSISPYDGSIFKEDI